MIVVAKNQVESLALRSFLRVYAGVSPSDDLQCLGWVSEGKLVMAVGLNGFVGKVAQIHIAYAPSWHFTPRAMLREVFNYAFNTVGLEMLLGVLNGKNERAMRYDAHLGFRELFRLPGVHDDGGDLVLLGLKKSECRYLAMSAEQPPMLVAAAGRA